MSTPTHSCPRCGCQTTGKICGDCREVDPTWFILTGLYHPRANPSGARTTNRKKATT